MTLAPLPRRHFLAMLPAGCGLPAAVASTLPATLEDGFSSPPESARPWAYWFWMNGNISREGITADLEAMRSAGINGVIIMSNDGKTTAGPVRFMTPEWHTIFRHMLTEADRLGIVIDMNNDDGWNSGGPWIGPEQSMQKMVWTETRVQGGQRFSAPLPHAPEHLGFYRDVAVLAFRTPAEVPDTAHAVLISAPHVTAPAFCELQASDDGQQFRTVRRFDTGWRTGFAAFGSVTAAVPETHARQFRVVGTDLAGKPVDTFKFNLIGSPRIDLWEFKAGFQNIREHGGGAHMLLSSETFDLPKGAAIPRDGVLDLTSKLDATGRLAWDVPAGNWTVLRIGHRPTGAINGPATQEGKGLDCDKLNRAAVDIHLNGMLTKLIENAKQYGAKSFRYIHNDSWECGAQNWTAGFRGEFHKRRGYDLLPFLPVMAGGRVVGSVEMSERFLWDLRRTISDLMADYYWKRFGELAKRHGMQYSLEPAGRQQFLYDTVNLLGTGDLPMGEFWMTEERPRPDCKLAASTAHIYGKTVAGAEAFTCNGGPGGEWRAHPFWLKAKGDAAFCHGINRLVFHRYVHQPYLDRKPGMHWGTVGTQIERTQTWWQTGAPAWIEYISRCQFLLQQGRFIADVCYLTSEGVPNALVRRLKNPPLAPEGQDASVNTELTLSRRGGLPPQLPQGFDFDACNPESVMRMSVQQGRLVLPSGMSYRVLVLPPGREMTPPLLRKLRDLVEAGAIVMGPKPLRSPSLQDSPRCDRDVKDIAEQLWGDCDGSKTFEHAFGKGRVIWGKPLAAVLDSLRVPADFAYTARPDAEIDYIHRRDGDSDIYFVSNQREREEEVECTFRASGNKAELWHPDTGRVISAPEAREKNGLTSLRLKLDPAGSVFVLLRKTSRAPAVVTSPRTIKVVTLSGPWTLHFPSGWGAPASIMLDRLISWHEHADEGVRYFSGTATYEQAIEIPGNGSGRLHILDLGAVKEIAEVVINGKRAGVLWKPPFRLDITAAVKPGINRLEIRVTNLWPNRLIGDLRLPENKRHTWTNSNPYKSDSPLIESGLLGPVTLHSA